MKLWIVFILAFLIGIFSVKILHREQLPIGIIDAHIINIDKDVERYRKASAQIRWAKRWKAVNGKECSEEDYREAGVGEGQFRPGELGCWLSHKRLLEKLAGEAGEHGDAHLILEDDFHMTEGCWEKWNKAWKSVPGDWDMIYLGNLHPRGVRVNEYIIKGEPYDNICTFAYVVKHESIGKILKGLNTMNEPIDNQLVSMFGRSINAYIFDPFIIGINPYFKSTIVTE